MINKAIGRKKQKGKRDVLYERKINAKRDQAKIKYRDGIWYDFSFTKWDQQMSSNEESVNFLDRVHPV
jgi:cellobiose phosphorylase